MKHLLRKAAYKEWTQLKINVFQAEKLKNVPSKPFPNGHKLQDLEFTLLDFSLALVQYFLTMPPFLLFGMTISYVLEAYD